MLLLCASTALAQFSTVNVRVLNQVNSSAGINGRFQVTMSTNLQLVPGSSQFFNQTPTALPALSALQPQHIRVQMIPSSDPLTAPGVWDFSALNVYLQYRVYF